MLAGTGASVEWPGEPLMRGVDIAADLVTTAIGPAGRAVLVGRNHGPPILLRDGHAIMQQLDLPHGAAQMGIQAMRELAWRTTNQVGGGASTTITMARELLQAGRRAFAAGIAPRELQAAMDEHCLRVVTSLQSVRFEANATGQLARIAAQASHGDEAVGKAVADAHGKIGPSGLVRIKEGRGLVDELRIEAGLKFDQGWLSPHFAGLSGTVEFDDPLILCHLGAIDDLAPIVRVLEMMARVKRPLVIIAETVRGEALTTLIANCRDAGMKVAAVAAPGMGPWRGLMLDDIAVATGGMMIAGHLGTSLVHLRPHMLGRARKISITGSSTTIVGALGDPDAVKLLAQDLKRSIASEKYLSLDREQHQQRLARLEAGVATLFMGGTTATEVTDRRNRAQAASAALVAARDGGVLRGGSAALIHAGKRARVDRPETPVGHLVSGMFQAALRAPFQAICNNAGLDGRSLAHKLGERDDQAGFDIIKADFVPGAELLDALPLLRAAVINSVSTAIRILGVGAIVARTKT